MPISTVIPAQAGIQQNNYPRSGQRLGIDLLYEDFSINWITNCILQFALRAIGKPMFASASCLRSPACAGMTNAGADGRSGMRKGKQA